MAAKLEIKQVRSLAGSSAHQRRVMKALGFKRREQVVVHSDTPTILGMIDKVRHLVDIRKREE
ncbi:MAG: 50S ribosomal protein L30 [candidate division Zixibacteria bacterium RBG_16_53_22]|nr:MAG: 50S ribosomal protein L30 [candidate division Zixibacteria bacterium RBG_16_53_22]